ADALYALHGAELGEDLSHDGLELLVRGVVVGSVEPIDGAEEHLVRGEADGQALLEERRRRERDGERASEDLLDAARGLTLAAEEEPRATVHLVDVEVVAVADEHHAGPLVDVAVVGHVDEE